ncbi:hypothetical protein PIB30_092358 [Stylosanthes scabra]|uniref:Uncharacterized protein n=1 Tax=Stylosanthes scabra TaxID=79078 RepID=A0ABU6SVS3_9FABA|nr:hypothetical protein [Stylosanthes scabra]
MEDLSMFQRPMSVALEYEKPETYGTVLIYPLDRLVECGSVDGIIISNFIQYNRYDCGTFVMKRMEEQLQEFMNEIISEILLSKSNKLIGKAIPGVIDATIHKPSAALQSPYVQVTTEELNKLK